MKRVITGFFVLVTTLAANAQNVGIGTNTPLQTLHVEGNVYVKDSFGVGAVTPLQKLHVEGKGYIKDSLGIGVSNPAYPLTFAPVYGEKISLYTGINAGRSFGFAVAPSLLQIHADTGNADIAFGYGVQSLFTENVRIKGNGNTGIGTTTPTYRLDVWHKGGTGIRTISDTSFSVIDIDAFNGDAALRFNRNGSARWNIRNRPTDDYLEIFELGGGGSRMVVQDATGNVGIGETTNPTYKLDVLHFGGTGIRNRSSFSFSVIDIDAFTGDASLRFLSNGVPQWNFRNRPSDNDLEFFEMGGGGSRMIIQNATGNVGIGNFLTPPSYKLDVVHEGSSGIRSKSSSNYSVVDVDAFNGDASVRFANNGAYQWLARNRAGDNAFEIFEYATASRFVIQDGTGNVGIGTSFSPTYKLDVLHGGGNGLRNRSSSSFSNLDIDAFNGDAAVRFVRNGSVQWNIRNDPATDNLQFFEFGGGGERMRIDNNTGVVNVVGTLTKGAGSFKIDHPLDPENKYLYHSFVESPDMKNIYDGNITTDASGKAVVQLPDYFEQLNKDYRYQLTVIGAFAQAIISKKVNNNQFEITTSLPNVEVSWMVTGIRQDAYANKNRIPNSVEKEAANKGKYMHPDAFGQPASKGINFQSPNKEPSSLDEIPETPNSAAAKTETASTGSESTGMNPMPDKKDLLNKAEAKTIAGPQSTDETPALEKKPSSGEKQINVNSGPQTTDGSTTPQKPVSQPGVQNKAGAKTPIKSSTD